MDNSNFLRIISSIADFITLAGVVTAIRFAILKRNENLLAFKISIFLQFCLRTAIIAFALFLIYTLTDIIYGFMILVFKGNETSYYWENGKEIGHLLAYFISYTFGISIAWMICTIIWTSSLNHAKDFINLFLPGNKLLLKQTPNLEILNASYGSDDQKIDVTPILRQMITKNQLTVKVSNEIAGDPHNGVVKKLDINYRIGQKIDTRSGLEGAIITIPGNNN